MWWSTFLRLGDNCCSKFSTSKSTAMSSMDRSSFPTSFPWSFSSSVSSRTFSLILLTEFLANMYMWIRGFTISFLFISSPGMPWSSVSTPQRNAPRNLVLLRENASPYDPLVVSLRQNVLNLRLRGNGYPSFHGIDVDVVFSAISVRMDQKTLVQFPRLELCCETCSTLEKSPTVMVDVIMIT